MISSLNDSLPYYKSIGMHFSFEINPAETVGPLSSEASGPPSPVGLLGEGAVMHRQDSQIRNKHP